MLIMEDYSWVEIVDSVWNAVDINYNPNCCGGDAYYDDHLLIVTVKNAINWSLFTILVAWLILISFLIYRKHKWEKWLWKKILKWDLIFVFIIIAIWFIISLIFWYLRARPAMPAI